MNRAFWLLSLALVSAGSPRLASGAQPLTSAPVHIPSVLLVTIDTWRWDYVGAAKTGKVATPNLDRLAREGAYFPKALTPCPLTTPAHATILTGLIPHRHGIRDNLHFRLEEGIETLASAFGKRGYSTMAVVSGSPLRKIYGLDRGFQRYDDSGLGKEGDFSFTPSRRRADETTRRALAFAKPGAKPVFLWVHYYDLHAPCRAPSPFAERYPRDPYAAAVAYVDSEVGKVVAALPHDPGRKWIILVTGDHGEGLGDHGEASHGLLLYESTVEVPLILWTGGALKAPAGGHPGLVDVAPTLCAMAGVPPPPSMDGTSLLSGVPPGRWLSSESAYVTLAYGLNPIFLLRKGPDVWVRHGVEEVYNLERDPGQMNNLAGSSGAAFAREASGQTARFFGEDPVADFLGTTLALPASDAQALRGLGYIGGPVPAKGAVMRADLRVFVKDMARFNAAMSDAEAGRYAQAAWGFRNFLAKYPRSARGYLELGLCLLGQKKFDDAATAFSRALGLDPLDAVSALNLGNLRMMKGDSVGALRLYERSLKAEEQQPEAHLNAALALKDDPRRTGEAAIHLKRFLELAPDDREAPAIRALLAQLQSGAGRPPAGKRP